MMLGTSFKGKKVLIRVDFNVPIGQEGAVTDDRRIRSSLATIFKVIREGGIAILLSHFGRPKNGYEARYSLHRLVPLLSKLLEQPVFFAPDCVGHAVQACINELAPGSVILLENVRFHRAEVLADKNFAEALALLADVYINDAFGTIHRKHASTVVLPYFFQERYAGCLVQQEIAAIDKLFSKEQGPIVAIMGGKKLADKVQPMNGLIQYLDHLLIGGGFVLPFYYAQQGCSHALTDTEEEAITMSKSLLANMEVAGHCTLHLPTDLIGAAEMSAYAAPMVTTAMRAMDRATYILDIGPDTQERFSKLIVQAKTIFWAGPMGVFEWEHFSMGTKRIALAVAVATANGAYSIVGGGETAAAIKQMGYEQQISHISTGGSALLAYIAADRKLPSLEAVLDARMQDQM